MTTLDAIMVKDLVAPRPGSHLSTYLPEAIDTNRRLSTCILRRFRQRVGEWSGWFDERTDEDSVICPPEHLTGDAVATHLTNGVVVFAADGFEHVIPLPGSTIDLLVGGSEFFLTPLMTALQADRAFHLLTLSRHRAELFLGSCRSLHPIPVANMPDGVGDTTHSQKPVTTRSLSLHPGGRGRRMETALCGLGDSETTREHDLEQYLFAMETAVTDSLLSSMTPLVLVGEEEVVAAYRRVNTYPHLLTGRVDGNPDHHSTTDLHAAVWSLVQSCEPPFCSSLRLYHRLRGTGWTVEAVEEAVLMAAEGMLGTVLISPDRYVWGKFDPACQRVETHSVRHPGDDELTNLTAVHVLRHGGTVFVVPNCELGERSALGLRWLPVTEKLGQNVTF